MSKLLACIKKELLILLRDKGGLAVLFLMPMVLVMVVSLVQNNVLEEISGTRIDVVLLDSDGGDLGGRLETLLGRVPALNLLKDDDGRPITKETAFRKIETGEYQFLIEIGEGASRQLEARCLKEAKAAFSGNSAADTASNEEAAIPVALYSAPTVQGAVRGLINQALERAVFAVETEIKLSAFSTVMAKKMERALYEIDPLSMGTSRESLAFESPEEWFQESMVTIREASVGASGEMQIPNAVQQNVPAWTLFGIFFICVPFSGALIRERQEGIMMRLFTVPVSFSVIIGGKIIAYLMICFVQGALMLLAGKYFLPLFGTPALAMGQTPLGLFLVMACAAFAAIGYGLLLGSVARNYEQASMFGAVSVVVAAALGGIMVPLYVMPHWMQTVSAVSPLSWGMAAFLELFVKGGTVGSIQGELVLLFLFGIAATSVALWQLRKRVLP
jgi:ABC-2 type transport system permease protein